MEKGWGNSALLHSISPTVKHQKSQSIFPEREGRSWRGTVGKKCINGNETKAKIRHKKIVDFGKKKSSSLALRQMQSRDSWVPPYEWKVVGVLLGGRPTRLPTAQQVFWIQLVSCSKWDFKLFYCKKIKYTKEWKELYKESSLPMPASTVSDTLPTCFIYTSKWDFKSLI